MIDIIICTYNRPEKVLELICQLQTCFPAPKQIIVVDSSELKNEKLQNLIGIKYITSIHKNQPYQRYLGYKHSVADYILFLDDDMEIIDFNFLNKISEILIMEKVSGIALNFKDKQDNTSLSFVPKSKLFNKLSKFKRFKNWLTGLPELEEGKLGLCGNRGKQPQNIAETQYVSGGAFIAKRSEIFQNFNFQLFDLFEERIGMGEDTIIGYSLHKKGKLISIPTIFFYHNDQNDSSYSVDLKKYAKRVAFSRIYLSLEKTRLDGNSYLKAKLHFHYYMFFRVFGLVLNYMINPSLNRKNILFGTLSGWILAIKFNFDKKLYSNKRWLNEIKKDLN